MKYALIAIAILITGCATPQQSAHREALWNFKYVPDVENELRVYDRIDQPFEGDCEDFAFTLQRQIGGDVWYIVRAEGAHAALDVDGIIYDNMSKHPIPRVSYPGVFVTILEIKQYAELSSR
ncbi:MAG: hypothetical protein Tp138OMZ00d2C19078241_20 [Prokaryotic dsDNA virus sp.]|jgi:hypothetical protein|nr:MAG: hypothetical protein Tp138OMZ00d2C19078241_20 [Prokaryotic dsDNA virus sp.]|tara:strand:- start:33705 stop:34070 length:366 start_codon:yes stop_codon:yes gene_type:complete